MKSLCSIFLVSLVHNLNLLLCISPPKTMFLFQRCSTCIKHTRCVWSNSIHQQWLMSLPLLLILLNIDPCQIILLSPPNFQIKALSMLPVEEVSEADLMGFNGRGSSRLACQICGKFGHSAMKCFHRFALTCASPTPLLALILWFQLLKTFLAIPTFLTDPAWYMDSGATHHVTVGTRISRDSRFSERR